MIGWEMRVERIGGAVAVLALGVAATGGTVAAAPQSRTLIQSVQACRAVADPTARLACFDAAAAALDTAISRKDVAVVDREDVQKTRRSLFGFTTPKLGLFGVHEDKDDEVKTIDGVVRSIRNVAYDRYEITLEDGAVWKNIEPFRRDPRPGSKVHITRAALGSYFFAVDGMNGTRAIRVR